MTATASERDGAVPRRVSRAAARQLAGKLSGQIVLPGVDEYERARRVFNAMIDRRPAVIIRCETAEDVVHGLGFAQAHAVPLAVKGGGHGVAGRAVCDAGVMLDLSAMKSVAVDPDARVVTAGPGVTLGDLDRATQPLGLATPTGVVSVTGLSGLALGGGLGWLNGKHGLTCDNLLAADVATATGDRIVYAGEAATSAW
jgi:FAD/FMN-containing dehydrogenase